MDADLFAVANLIFVLNLMGIWRLTIFGRPAEGFFSKKAPKVSVASLGVTFRCGLVCSCEFSFCLKLNPTLEFNVFLTPC